MSVMHRGAERDQYETQSARRPATKTTQQKEPITVTEAFQASGPLGVVWAHHARTGSGTNADSDYACIKSVKPSSVAAGRPALQPGLILGYVNGEYVKGQDYCERNRCVRSACALDLIACSLGSRHHQLYQIHAPGHARLCKHGEFDERVDRSQARSQRRSRQEGCRRRC